MTSILAHAPAMLPFFGTLFSFALLPGIARGFWHRNMVRISLGWVALGLILTALRSGPTAAAADLWTASIADFLPFIAVLMALYTLGGGILIAGGPWGRPGGNFLLLTIGTLLAGIMGTIGASLLLIHPLLASNGARPERRHLVIGFIILVANAGGALSPLGDPPLLIGFLRGVPFFWPTIHLALPALIVAVPTLAITYLIDRHLARNEPAPKQQNLRVRGLVNIGLLILFVAALTASGVIPGPIIALGPARLPAGQIAITVFAGIIVGISELTTPNSIRAHNKFAWAPMREISILFFAIFATIPPVLRQLASTGLRPDAALWFWASGLTSAFLDAAPTYLMFFQAAGGNAAHLIKPPATLLTALSAGSVFFGAMTYLGNAPNLMIRAIAARRGVRMPGFFTYLAIVSAVLVPIFVIQTFIFFV